MNIPIDLEPGKVYDFGGHPYGVCHYCHKLIRLDKPLIGSTHICLTEDERRLRDAADWVFNNHPHNPNRRK